MTTAVDSLRQTAYRALRDKIASGALGPGDRISELALSKELGVSRAPVREAVSQLASDGIVQQVPGFGAFVRLPSEEEVGDLFDFRAALESFAAGRAAAALRERELDTLRTACRQQVQLIRRVVTDGRTALDPDALAAWAASNDAIHQTILAAGGNALIVRHAADLSLFRALFTRYFSDDQAVRDAAPPDAEPPTTVVALLLRNLREHRRVLHALLRRDAAAASAAMADHIASAKRETLAQMRRDRVRAPSPPAVHQLVRLREKH